MSNDSIQNIELEELATVTGGASSQRPTQPTYKSDNGKVRVFAMPGGDLEILNLSRSANPRRVIVRPVVGL